MADNNWIIDNDSMDTDKGIYVEAQVVITNNTYFFEYNRGEAIVGARVQLTGAVQCEDRAHLFQLVVWDKRLIDAARRLELRDKIRVKASIVQFQKRVFDKNGEPMRYIDGTEVQVQAMNLRVHNMEIL